MAGRPKAAMSRAAPWLALALLAAGALPARADKLDAARVKFKNEAFKNMWELGLAHIELGLWCRDAGLVPQATAEFLRAEEVAGERMNYAVKLVSIMRQFGDKFWKTVQKHPVALLRTYDSKAQRIEADALRDRLRLAKNAASWGLEDESFETYLAAVRLLDAPLQFDAKDQLILPVGTLSPELSARIKAVSIAINDKLYIRDEVLALVPDVKSISESDGERVRVRTMGTAKEAEDIRAIVEALLPALEADLDGRPTRKLQVFVFKEKKAYVAYLAGTKQDGFSVALGLADGATNTALVNAEGQSPDVIRSAAMHEIAHLFMYGVTPAVMPSWYAEGFADMFAGTGTFEWDGKVLKTGGMLSKGLLDGIKSDAGYLPLSELISGEALTYLAKDRTKASRFYVESWAFLRFMRTATNQEMGERFHLWELACKGGAVGARAGKARERDTAPGRESFQKAFGADLAKLETAFRAWLATL